jgi:hypothetical protein
MARKTKARTSTKASRTRSTKGSSAKRSGSRRASRSEGSDVSDYRRKVRDGKLAQGKKGSCAPKLFMLLLPFAVLGTYFVLRS